MEGVMADRVPASIIVGGRVSTAIFDALVETIQFEGLAIEWDAEPFEASHCVPGEPLHLYAHEVAWGRFDGLERFCAEHHLPFVRWSGGYPGEWSAERIVFTGEGEPDSYMVDEGDRVVIDRPTVVELGSVEAALGYFEAADFKVPPLFVDRDDPLPPATSGRGSIPGGEMDHG
jgi:hypothetical protein